MPTILIIGGGIGGLATAACLQVRGIPSIIYERAAELREVGAALALWPNAMRVLKKLGVLQHLADRAHVPPAGVLRDWRGRELIHMVSMKTDVPTTFAHRADLHGALLTAIPPHTLHLNKAATAVERREHQIRATFSDGTTSDWADGLIAADGIRSILREATLHDGPPIYRGYIAWRGVATFESPDIVGESWGPRGQRFGFIPLGRGRIGWWATANKPGNTSAETCAHSQAEWKRELIQRYAGWHHPIPQVIESTPEPAIICNPIMDRVPIKRPWGQGPMTLLGDAAHPTTPNLGQGACMAIEDAAVVAHALAGIPDIAQAFRVYESTRFSRTARIMRESLKLGALGQWNSPLACGVRNFIMRHSPSRGVERSISELWSYDAWETPLIVTPS
ncbi:MAG TPA: FAD-dependent monooxygenase [Phycisphaerae bacterium]|jgi:2-polyprenyl-6-methoxyphenol hydroxylase-like FAD-dependent oxidoreductase